MSAAVKGAIFGAGFVFVCFALLAYSLWRFMGSPS